MWFGSFIVRSLWLSLFVALFWLPVLFIFGYGVTFVFEIFQNEPIALAMVIILTIQPVLVLLAIFAIRGGLMSLKVTRGTELASLGKIIVRISKMNLPLMWAITVLFGLSTSITGLRLIDSEFLVDFENARSLGSLTDIGMLMQLIGGFPIFLVGGWVLGACVAYALLGVSVAAGSAMAGVKPPNHHSIWGIASNFANLLLLSLAVVIVPFIAIVAILGVDTTIADVLELDPVYFYSGAAFVTWAFCALAAGTAIGYSIALKDEQRQHQEMLDAIAGTPMPMTDLKSLRESRMQNRSNPE